MSAQERTWRPPFVVSAILLIAFAVRVYNLDFHSLWSDEGISLVRSSQPLTPLLRDMPVEQMPGYFVLLHCWLALSGEQDFALRFFSLWPSVLVVAIAYRLAVDLGNRRAGMVAALLLALNPLQIWYAQEARTYSWLMAGALLATWLLWRLLTDDPPAGTRAGPRLWLIALAYALAVTLTVYLHFYGFLVPLTHTIFVLGWFTATHDRSRLLRWISAGGLALLLFLPWLPRTLQIVGFTGWRDPIDPWQIPWRFLAAYTAGDALPSPWHVWLTWLYLALALWGLAAWWRQRTSASLFLTSQTLIPWLAVFLLALRKPDTHERYAIFIAGPLLILAAGGVSWLWASPPWAEATGLKAQKARLTWLPGWRVRSSKAATVGRRIQRPTWLTTTNVKYVLGRIFAVVLGSALCGAGVVGALRQYSDPALQKPDFRRAAYAIQDWAQPGDLILVDGPDPRLVFLHYYHGPAPVHDLRFLGAADFATVDATLNELTAGARRVWEVLYFHEPGPVQFWLATHGWMTPPTEYNGIRVALYGLPTAETAVAFQPVQVAFGAELVLTQAALTPTSLPSGELLGVTTQWQVNAPPPEYKFSLRLTGSEGQPVQFQDYVPANWFAPTSQWPVGAITTERRGFLLPRDLPPGRYRVTLRLYDPTTGEAVATEVGQDVLLGEFMLSG